jgi:hypothetical protein
MRRPNRAPKAARDDDRGRTPTFFPAAVQPKLTVNAPGDAYEREADAVADTVMRMDDGPAAGRLPSISPLAVQRTCADCEEAGAVQRLALQHDGEAAGPISALLQASRGAGRPLPEETRAGMERRFGTEFGGVRVHADDNAARLSRKLSARAFTQGRDIYFGSGEFAPGTREGKRLLAHELTHVVQQRGAGGQVQRQAFSSTLDFSARLNSRQFTVAPGHQLTATIEARPTPDGCSGPSRYSVRLLNVGAQRSEQTVSYSVGSRERYTWRGLAGGTYQFVFVANGMAAGCSLTGTIDVTQTSAVDDIVPTARKYVGSTHWAYDANTPPGAGTNKCNQFVYEVLNEAGATVPLMERRRWGIPRPSHPPLAGQWASTTVSISGWDVVSQPQPGDTISEAHDYADASGRVGIVSSIAPGGGGTTISAARYAVLENDWGFRQGQNPTFRRYRGR